MPMYKRSLLVLLLLVIVGAGGAMYGYSTQDEVIPLDAAEQVSENVKEQVTVSPAGKMHAPLSSFTGVQVHSLVSLKIRCNWASLVLWFVASNVNVLALLKSHVWPSMAKRIIEYRNTEGTFQSPEDLKKIKGIGDAKYEKLKDKVTI